MRNKGWLLAGIALMAAAAMVLGAGRWTRAADYTLRPAPPPADATAVTLSVVVTPGTPRERFAAIRDELRQRYSAARLLRLSFFDDVKAADHPQGPDAPVPEAGWWQHYLAQYNLNRNTGYQWFGRLYPKRAERWE